MPTGQTWPQEPQLFGSYRSEKHCPLQIAWPALVQAQIELMHVDPAGHLVPHVPQLFESLVGSTHCPPQRASEPGHVHEPAWQVAPLGHAVPHPPQCAGLVIVSTH
jgi:hypothetical protein